MKNKIKIITILGISIITVIILGIIMWKIILPKYYLNEALKNLDNGNYKLAFETVQKGNNESDINLIKAITLQKFINRVSGCVTVMGNIITEINNLYIKNTKLIISGKITKEQIDFSSDDGVTNEINELEKYLDDKYNYTREMFPEKFYDIYDGYFELVELVIANMKEPLNAVNSEDEYKVRLTALKEVTSLATSVGQKIIKFETEYNFVVIDEKYMKRYNISDK